MRDLRTALTVLALGAALGCGGSPPTAPTGNCRRYPTSYGGQTCRLETGRGVELVCRFGSQTESWHYDSLADFIDEAAVPNRPRLNTHSSTRSGMVFTGSSTYWRSYRYDGQRRLVERIRGTRAFGGTFPGSSAELDRAEFTDWDAVGRPIRGVLTAYDGTSESFTILYDDERRWMVWSTGESQLQDSEGIVINQVDVFVSASGRETFTRTYEVRETAEVCE